MPDLRSFRAGFSQDGTLAVPLQTCIHKHAVGHLDHSSAIDPEASFASLAEGASACSSEASLWQLSSLLFDPLESEVTPYQAELEKMSRLSAWLKNILGRLVDPSITSLDAMPVLKALLLSNDLERAVNLAISNGHPRFAALLAGCVATDPSLRRTCFASQLAAWRPFLHRIPQEHLLIVQLLAGQNDEVQAWMLPGGQVHWLARFAMIFWYGIGERPAERLAMALESLKQVKDVRIGLLAIYMHSNYHVPPQSLPLARIDEALSWQAFHEISQNLASVTRISWILAKKLLARPVTTHLLQRQLSELLEAIGEYELALQLCQSDSERSQLIMRRFEYFGFLEDSKAAAEARAAFLVNEGASALERYQAFAACQDWPQAFSLLALSIGPECVIKKDQTTLSACLSMIPAHQLRSILPGDLNTTLISILYHYMSLCSSFPQDRPDASLIDTIMNTIKSVPKEFIRDRVKVQVMLAAVSAGLVEVQQTLGLPALPLKHLPLSSDVRIALAAQLVQNFE